MNYEIYVCAAERILCLFTITLRFMFEVLCCEKENLSIQLQNLKYLPIM